MLARSVVPYRLGAWLVCACLIACVGNGDDLDLNGRPIVSGADGGGSVTPGPTASSGSIGTFSWIQENIFNRTCAPACHHGSGAPKGLALDARNAYRLLVRVPSAEVPSLLRVKPGNPDNSYLLIKLVTRDARRAGDRMPRGGPTYLTNTQLDAVRRWIEKGAPNQ